jgi:hypothetical protein
MTLDFRRWAIIAARLAVGMVTVVSPTGPLNVASNGAVKYKLTLPVDELGLWDGRGRRVPNR